MELDLDATVVLPFAVITYFQVFVASFRSNMQVVVDEKH